MNMDDLIPLFGIIFLFGAPVAAWIVSRVLAHQERMEMMRRGFMPPPDPRMARRYARMGWQQPPGPVPPPFSNVPPPPGANFYDPASYAQAQMRKGITVTLVGFALLIGLSFIGVRSDGTFTGGPWLLGGLIPMFVGIAQVINAVLNGARFPGMMAGRSNDAFGNQPSSFGPRPAPGPGPGPVPPEPPATPYAGWRPGPTPEIEKPTPPPDVR